MLPGDDAEWHAMAETAARIMTNDRIPFIWLSLKRNFSRRKITVQERAVISGFSIVKFLTRASNEKSRCADVHEMSLRDS